MTSGNKNMPTTKVKHRVNLLEWVTWYNISLELYNYKRVKEKLLNNSVVVEELISPAKLALGKKTVRKNAEKAWNVQSKSMLY